MMNIKEDFILSVRSLLASPLESMLLVLGLALSIGATASGLGMFAKANDAAKQLLQQVEYREILVSSKQSSSEMNVPITLQSTDETVTLSVIDLEAALLSPNIEFAYLSDRTRLRFNTGNAGFGGFRRGAGDNNNAADNNNRNTPNPNPDETQSNRQSTFSLNETNTGSEHGQRNSDRQTAPENTQGTQNENAQNENESPNQRFRADFEFATTDGPAPIIDSLPAYEVTPEFFSAMNLSVQKGGLFTRQEMQQGAKVLVLGSKAAASLFEDGVALNREVASFDNIFSIVGVLHETNTPIDYNAYRPSQVATQNAFRFAGFGGGAKLHFTVHDAVDLTQAQAQLTQYFNTQYGENVLNIQVPREAAKAASNRSEKIAIITLVLALSGLLIANVNVSNILYSRALRRRKQVGILKALGASKNNIFIMFLKESAVLLVFGGLIGVFIALGFSSLIALEGQSGLPLYAVLLGVLMSCLITLVFTLIPAIQASKTAPAIAMRVE
ncbi:MAG: ABC transporter permease [Saccharospirillaceae bacterium]|nr:ABC transporter permease [Saccharospirillaceae bacterium]